jgi:hypothetical protein
MNVRVKEQDASLCVLPAGSGGFVQGFLVLFIGIKDHAITVWHGMYFDVCYWCQNGTVGALNPSLFRLLFFGSPANLARCRSF